MKLINKDLTTEKMWINVCGSQFYAEIFTKIHGKWKTEVYFEDFNFEIDRELTDLIVKKIYKLWDLHNPKIYMCFGN